MSIFRSVFSSLIYDAGVIWSLQDRVDEQRKKEQHPVYKFPSALHHIIKNRIEPHFRTLGISTAVTGTPSVAPSLQSLASNDVTARSENSGWTIYKGHWQHMAQSSDCEWRLESNSKDALIKGDKVLVQEVKAACRRIGVLQLRDHAHLRVVQENLVMLKDPDVFFEIVEQPNQVLIAGGLLLQLSINYLTDERNVGASTDKVELVLHKVVALVDSSGD